MRDVTALDPDAVEDLTDVSFYKGEFEYLGLESAFSGCCGGDGEFEAQLWFGSEGALVGLHRLRFDLSLPAGESLSFLIKLQLEPGEAAPIDWLDVGWSLDF